MTKINGKTLPAALKEIETALVAMVPEAVRQLKVEGPCYAVVLCYIDSTTEEFTPYGLVAPEADRVARPGGFAEGRGGVARSALRATPPTAIDAAPFVSILDAAGWENHK